MKPIGKPTDAELEILRVLWRHGSGTVRLINDELNQEHRKNGSEEVGYTTTLKIMQIMTEKKLLQRDESVRTHVYTSAVVEKDIQQSLLDRLVDTAFGGSALKLVMQALGTEKTSKRELEEIRKLLDQKEQELSPNKQEREL